MSITLKSITTGMASGPEAIDANFKALQAAMPEDTGWQKLTVASGVTVGQYRIPMIRKQGNRVTLRGAVTLAKAGDIATLPYKPVDEYGFNCSQMSNTAGQAANVYVETDGTLKVITASNFDKGIFLNSIEFTTD